VHCVKVKGKPYFYYQPGRNTPNAAKAQRLPDDPRRPEWWEAYRQAASLPPPKKLDKCFVALIADYKASPEWAQMSESTRTDWARYLARIEELWGDLEVAGIEAPEVISLRDLWAHQPATANATLRCLSALMSWSIPRRWRTTNPCEFVPKLKGGPGYAPWPMEFVRLAELHLPKHLWWAVALALYSGQRQEDCLVMRLDAIRDGVMSVSQGKTGKDVWIPVHRDLRAVLEKIPKRATTVLSSSNGTPWTTDGFRASWRKALAVPRQKGAILPVGHPLWPIKRAGLVFHGLRKSAVVMLLEAGCTTAEVQAITGQSMDMVEHYSKQVNQRRLAAAAILKWENAAETSIVKRLVKSRRRQSAATR